MPQMAPLNWLMMFLIFSLTFMIFNPLNYFSFNYPTKSLKKFALKKKINWKW